jgi:hypothetical protein
MFNVNPRLSMGCLSRNLLERKTETVIAIVSPSVASRRYSGFSCRMELRMDGSKRNRITIRGMLIHIPKLSRTKV